MGWFTDDDLRRLAGPASYQRGAGYVDAVGPLDELPDGIVAVVEGTDSYQVRLRDQRGRLTGACTCPYGQDGNFCKHCVAVGLTLLGEPERRPETRDATVDLRGYLTSVDRADLVDLLLELAADDPVLYRRLSLRAATHGVPHLDHLGRLVAGLRTHGYLEYSQSLEHAEKADDVLDALDRLAGDTGPLYRLAIGHLAEALGQADDSAGAIGEGLDRAVDGYAAACRAAPPDPVDLATWLVDVQVQGTGGLEIAITSFADVLGRAGLTAYRRRLEEYAGRDDGSVRYLMEDYLRTISGDVDALVAHYAEDLPSAYGYVQIGEILRDAGRSDEAVAWLRRGAAEADPPDSRITVLLAELLTAAGRHVEAADVCWTLFAAQPGPGTHRRLLDAAGRAGALDTFAERADALLRERAAGGGRQADPLVAVLLAAGDIDGAWDAAGRYRCSSEILFDVAVQRARTHPADAVPVLARRVDDLIERRTRTAYAEAAGLLTDLRTLHRRAGSDFTGYLAQLRNANRRKSALLAELTRAGL